MTAAPRLPSATCRRGIPGGGALAAAVLVATAAAGCARPAPPVTPPAPREVAVARPVEREVTETMEFTGNATAVDTVDVRPRVAGYVTAVHFTDGQEVKPGDALFDIDDRSFRHARDQARAEITRQEAELAELETEVERDTKLLPSGAVTREQAGIVAAKRDMAAATLDKDRAILAQADLDLEFCRVTAPLSGRIGARTVSVGDLVSGGAAPTTLATIVSVDPIYVTFFADERSVLRARERAIAARRAAGGDAETQAGWRDIRELAIPVDVGLVTDEGFPRRGVLAFVDVAVRASTGTIRCRALLDNPDGLVAPGMFCRVRLPFGDPARALLVKDRAIGDDQGRRTVSVVGEGDRIEVREVELGPLDGGLRVVAKGLAPGDRVVVGGMQRAREGSVVRPVDVPME